MRVGVGGRAGIIVMECARWLRWVVAEYGAVRCDAIAITTTVSASWFGCAVARDCAVVAWISAAGGAQRERLQSKWWW